MLTRITPADIRGNKFSGLQMGHLFVSYDREVAIFVKDTEKVLIPVKAKEAIIDESVAHIFATKH